MYRNMPESYTERVDIIGNKAFMEFVEDLEKSEDLKFDTFQIGKDKLKILSVQPPEEKKEFEKALREIVIEKKEPKLLLANRFLSSTIPFPTSKKILEAKKTIFNYTPCDNDFEYDFAKFLDKSEDIKTFTKLPEQFGFCIQYTDTIANIRNYFPDFIAITEDGINWIIETKGREDIEVRLKENAAINWCRTASELTKESWKYLKVPQKEFEQLHPEDFE